MSFYGSYSQLLRAFYKVIFSNLSDVNFPSEDNTELATAEANVAQDTLSFGAGNKWIYFTKDDKGTYRIWHNKPDSSSLSEYSLINDSFLNESSGAYTLGYDAPLELNIPSFDVAGHFTGSENTNSVKIELGQDPQVLSLYKTIYDPYNGLRVQVNNLEQQINDKGSELSALSTSIESLNSIIGDEEDWTKEESLIAAVSDLQGDVQDLYGLLSGGSDSNPDDSNNNSSISNLSVKSVTIDDGVVLSYSSEKAAMVISFL